MTTRPPKPYSIALTLAALVALAVLLIMRGRSTVAPEPVREVAMSELTQRDERMYFGSEPESFTGVMIERYPAGELKSRSQLVNGVLHGVSEGWHTNGVVQVREQFREGVSHGLRTKWYDSGAKLSEATIEHGRITGVFRRWHENGTLAEEIEMTDNVPDGLSRAFYPSGALKAQARLKKGGVLEHQAWEEGEAPVVAATPGAN